MRILENDAFERLERLLVGKKVNGGPKKIAKGTELSKEYLADLNRHDWFDIRLADEEVAKQLELMKDNLVQKRAEFDLRFEDKKRKLTQGDELPPGVQKMVKVYVAVKRRLQPGDKMAGRHGNKGVVSKILPIEDMPHMADGTPMDIVLNPLGVPSRMNVGQILEVHLGWAAKGLGQRIDRMLQDESVKEAKRAGEVRKFLEQVYNTRGKPEDLKSMSDAEILELADNLRDGVPFATPVFDGAKEADLMAMLELAYPAESEHTQRLGFNDTRTQLRLYDGRTGEAFERRVTVGYMHVLKLHHLVDDKMHAVRPARTRWLLSSRWVVRHSSVVSASVRWKCGHWKLTARRTRCRKC